MPGKILPDHLVQRLLREGKSYGEVVRYLEEHENIVVTRQAISAWRKRRGDDMSFLSPQAMPWKLRDEHRQLEPAKVIRWHARVERGDALTPADQRRYDRAMAHLREHDAVIHYDPDTEQGWFLVPRREGVDTGVVRDPNASVVVS